MNDFSYMIHFGIISSALLLGVTLRNKVKLLQHFLIPSSIIGGFFLLIFYNYLAPKLNLNNDFLGSLVYHLLNISFISMMLRVPSKNRLGTKTGSIKQNVFAMIGQYGFQSLFGLLIAILLGKTIVKNLNPAIGYTLTLGFELGPGQAYTMAKVWESPSMGNFIGASSIGLTLATIGFIVGSIGGVILINIGIKNHWLTEEQIQKLRSKSTKTSFISTTKQPGSFITTNSESIDSFTYHICIVALTYLISYLFLSFISWLLSFAGNMGNQLAESLWGINFVFSALCAIIVRKVIVALKLESSLDDQTLNRINGLSVDLTVCASLGAISLMTISSYIIPIIAITIVGIALTCIALPWTTSRLFTDHQFYRTLVIFGTATGTLPTGLSLLRIVDPDFETPAAEDFVYATGLMLPCAIPIILSVNLPSLSFIEKDPKLLLYAILICLAYCLVATIGYFAIAKKKALANKGQFFYRESK